MEDDIIAITNAAYKVLDFFPEGEPLKQKAKEKVLAILEQVTLISEGNGWVSLKKYLTPDRRHVAMRLADDIEVLDRYLSLAKHQGWVSNINFLILSEAYGKVKKSLAPARENVFVIPRPALKEAPPPEIPTFFRSHHPGAENPGENLNPRQKKILEILQSREKAQVADILKEIPQVTKRTLRRDLDDLLKKKKVTRIGEWNQVVYQIGQG